MQPSRVNSLGNVCKAHCNRIEKWYGLPLVGTSKLMNYRLGAADSLWPWALREVGIKPRVRGWHLAPTGTWP